MVEAVRMMENRRKRHDPEGMEMEVGGGEWHRTDESGDVLLIGVVGTFPLPRIHISRHQPEDIIL